MILLLACAAPDPDTVVLVVLDTVRADVTDAGHAPRFATFADEGTRFDRAWSAAPWTLPSHGSLFSGLPPEVHGCAGANLRCDPGTTMLAERFAAAGYRTAGFSNNPWVTGSTGLADGFDTFVEVFRESYAVERAIVRYVDEDTTGLQDAGAARSVAALDRWLDGVEDEPVFVFVNLVEAHFPYDPPEGWRGRDRDTIPNPAEDRRVLDHFLRDAYAGTLSEADRAVAWGLYEDEVAYVDHQLGGILDTLAEHGRGDGLTVVTADHGEAFAEHRLGAIQLVDHQLSVYDELLHVPLAVRWPGVVPVGVEPADVSLLDVSPLMSWALGGRISATPNLLSPAPRPLTASWSAPANLLPVLADLAPGEGSRLASLRLRSARDGREKLIDGLGAALLFDVGADPGETTDLASARAERVEALRAALPAVTDAGAATPDSTTTDALRALGYVR